MSQRSAFPVVYNPRRADPSLRHPRTPMVRMVVLQCQHLGGVHYLPIAWRARSRLVYLDVRVFCGTAGDSLRYHGHSSLAATWMNSAISCRPVEPVVP